jgi:GTP-binding protein EngB required for normal cell division
MGAVVSLLAPLLSGAFGGFLTSLANPPSAPAPMPPQEISGKSQEEMREEARKTLGIDSVNCYNFGFAGTSRTGKSSLINAMLGMRDNSPGAAVVDEVECTMVIKDYVHPEYPHIVLWDIPGGGTKTHSAANYFMDKKLYAFDMIVIIGAAGFTELDIAIAEAAQLYHVPVVFVRSKSDIDIDNRSRRDKKPKKIVKDAVRQDIVTNIRSQLPKELRDREIFVVNSRVFAGDYDGFDSEDYLLDEPKLMDYVKKIALKRRLGLSF